MHLDDETIALLALGDFKPDPAQRTHLAECEQCSRELAELTRTVDYGRTARDVELLTPPDRVWTAIHSELGLVSSASPTSPTESPSVETVPAPVRPIRRWWALSAAALIVGVIVGATVVLWWPRGSSTVVAEATLAPLPAWDASGSARIEQGSAANSRQLLVTLDAAEDNDLREVWLMDPDTSGLISLGQLVGGDGQFTVPTEVDLRHYSVVDISQEPSDGNPAHSGNSIVRGELHPA